MDVHGLNPVIHKEKKSFRTLYKYDKISDTGDWKAKWKALDKNKKTKETYYKQHEEWELSNPGVYFRNNVWWWRPLWNFIYSQTDLISQEELNKGHMNEGLKIDAERSIKIADYLDYALRSGEVKKYKKWYEEQEKDSEYSYPFSEENVREFAIFCHDSGGFEIC